MHERSVVTGIDSDTVTVVPLISDVCLNCTSLCLYRGNPLTVSNRRHFDVREGSIVKIGSSRLIRAFFRLCALLFPLTAAVASYLLFPFFEPHLLHLPQIKILPPDVLKAGFVFGSFMFVSLLVLLVSRTNLHISKLEVREVITW